MPTIPSWLLTYVVTYIINLAVRQIDKFAEEFDWAKFKATVDERLRQALPDWLFEDALCAFVADVVDFVAEALSDEGTIKQVLEALAKKDYAAAIEVVRKIVAEFLSGLDAPDAPELPEPKKAKRAELQAKATLHKVSVRESLVKGAQ